MFLNSFKLIIKYLENWWNQTCDKRFCGCFQPSMPFDTNTFWYDWNWICSTLCFVRLSISDNPIKLSIRWLTTDFDLFRNIVAVQILFPVLVIRLEIHKCRQRRFSPTTFFYLFPPFGMLELAICKLNERTCVFHW